MRELVFALEFRGRGGAMPGSDSLRHARTTAPSQLLRTVISPGAIQSQVERLAGEEAVLESRVERFPDGAFVEDGTISYGSAGTIRFSTVGRGCAGPSPVAGRVHGAVIWTVTGGDGCLAGAKGLITSNFTVEADGQVVDHHITRLYIDS